VQPTKDQLDLMKRTASALQGASNSTLLEMKIMANYGADPRFAFLRKGKNQRWRETWQRLRRCESVENGRAEGGEKAKSENSKAAMILVGYDSSSDVEDDGEEAAMRAKKKRRLQLEKEWSAKRRKTPHDSV
jgi:hypothetical protein